MTRYDRNVKRKAGRAMDAEQKRTEKEKNKKSKGNSPKPKWRKLNDGGVAFGDKFKIGRTGLYVIPTILGLLLFFGIGMTGAYDEFLEDNFDSIKVEQNFAMIGFDECEEIDFNNDICLMEYKFCREYADGESICQFAESDPFVNVDPTERKYTEEEQDFLPPGGFLNIIPSIPEASGASLAQEKIWAANVAKCGKQDCSNVEDENETDEPEPFDGKTIHLGQSKYEAIQPISIGIERSNSCKVSDNCISNRELVTLYDNTHQVYSGEFVDDGNGDIHRLSSEYERHWNIYPYVGMPVVIAVEPDARWIPYMTSNIIVEPSSFTYIDHGYNKVPMGLGTGGNVTHYNNIFIKGCDWGRVNSDPIAINQLVEYFLSQCEKERPAQEEVIIIPNLPIVHGDHKWYQYSQWLKTMAEECKGRC
jgi:hypothetical protein